MTVIYWTIVVAGIFALTWWLVPRLLRAVILRRLGARQRVYNPIDTQAPLQTTQSPRVAVLGAGIAGLTAAVTLARRGFKVTLYEKSDYIGGKLGSWPKQLSTGESVWVSHGYHAFFRSYFNLTRFLASFDATKELKSIGDYVILAPDGTRVQFANINPTPVFNLLGLARAGVFKLSEALRAPGRDLYGVFLEYDEKDTFQRFDQVSFEAFNQLAQVPPGLQTAFNTFARAFFADADKLSLAELIKSFHFYYLGHDVGLVYDYPTRDYEPWLLKKIRDELAALGSQIQLSTSVRSLQRTKNDWLVNGEAHQAVVLAADVVGSRDIVTKANGINPETIAQFERLKAGQRYCVIRLWIDKDVRTDVPVFVITDRARVLDAVSFYHRIETDSAQWTKAHGGAVIELHCYAVPDDVTESEVRQSMLDDLLQFFPELNGYRIADEHLQIKRDFTAFHTGQYAHRPTVETGESGLFCAGDWVKLPFPAMLMEAACASGLCAANAILRQHGLQEEPVHVVPLKGLMAGMPQPPGRKSLLAPSMHIKEPHA
jgi:carotenoid phi-ring synthase / carotenoid chi-ring synthase